jgi:hypothetical protein
VSEIDAFTLRLMPPVVRRMRTTGETLCCGHNANGTKVWWFEPSQRKVGKAGAARAISCRWVRPGQDALLSDESQTYRYAGP